MDFVVVSIITLQACDIYNSAVWRSLQSFTYEYIDSLSFALTLQYCRNGFAVYPPHFDSLVSESSSLLRALRWKNQKPRETILFSVGYVTFNLAHDFE